MPNTITAIETRANPAIASPAKMLRHHLGAAWTRFMVWRARRATKLLLQSLDDHTLADIGVARGGIDAVVRDIERQRTRWYVG